jgi:YHS domain-containing protein
MTETNETEIQTACGGVIKDPSKYPNAIYQGKQVYFCTLACLRAYNQDPDRFMAGEIEHPLDEE